MYKTNSILKDLIQDFLKLDNKKVNNGILYSSKSQKKIK